MNELNLDSTQSFQLSVFLRKLVVSVKVKKKGKKTKVFEPNIPFIIIFASCPNFLIYLVYCNFRLFFLSPLLSLQNFLSLGHRYSVLLANSWNMLSGLTLPKLYIQNSSLAYEAPRRPAEFSLLFILWCWKRCRLLSLLCCENITFSW